MKAATKRTGMAAVALAFAGTVAGMSGGSAFAGTEAAVSAGPPNVTGAALQSGKLYKAKCPVDDYLGSVKVIKKSLRLRKDYYSASPKLVGVSYGQSLGDYGAAKNSYGHTWIKVQYTNVQTDVCGWVYHTWVE